MKHFFLILLLLPLFISCEKEDEGSRLSSQEALLTKGTWKLISQQLTIQEQTIEEIDINNWLKDDVVSFYEYKTWIMTLGETQLPDDPKTLTGTWELKGNKLITSPQNVILGSSLTAEYIVEELTDKKLTLSRILLGTKYTYTYRAL